MEKTIFTKFFGDAPRVRVLDLLLTGRDFEYCLSDMAEQAEIGRATLYRMLEELLKNKIIVPTKQIGRIQLFKLNQENKEVKRLVMMYDDLLDIESEKEIEKQQKLKKPVMVTA